VDHSPTSPFRDRIYIIWHNNRPAFTTFRNAAGWHAPLQVSHTETIGTAIGSDITTNAEGTVFAVWPDTGSRGVFFVKSTDGGETYTSPPLLIAKTFASFQINLPAFNQRAALVGASVGAFGKQVYVTWTDLSGEDGCKTTNNAPNDDVNSACKSRIWFARSLDSGQNWSQPATINPAADLSDQFTQKLAVDPESGVIGVTYYGTGTGAARTLTNLMFQASHDGGQTWSKALKVASQTTDETGQDADTGNQYGDYNGLSVVKDVFAPCWTDRRGGGAEAVFTARITAKQNAQGALEVAMTNGASA
jgi:hypothetical protein